MKSSSSSIPFSFSGICENLEALALPLWSMLKFCPFELLFEATFFINSDPIICWYLEKLPGLELNEELLNYFMNFPSLLELLSFEVGAIF